MNGSTLLRAAARAASAAAMASLLLSVSPAAHAQTMAPLLLDDDGTPLTPVVREARAAGDGRFVVFTSLSSALAPGGDPNQDDVFLLDRADGSLRTVSVTPDGASTFGASYDGRVTPDGRYVAFASDAANLVANDGDTASDVFVRDMVDGVTVLVSGDVPADEYFLSRQPDLSDDGQVIAFTAFTIDPSTSEIFVHERPSSTTVLLSRAPDGSASGGFSDHPSISADGAIVAFHSWAAILGPIDTNFYGDIFVHDRTSSTTQIVSVATDGTAADGDNVDCELSADGSCVVLRSKATTLVPFDTTKAPDHDVVLRDLVAGTTELVSIALDGSTASATSAAASISADGRFVAFTSMATDVAVDSPTYGLMSQLFVRDRRRGFTRLVTRDAEGDEAQHHCTDAAISDDGSLVLFETTATNFFGKGPTPLLIGHSVLIQHEASSTSYGAGWPGKLGVPAFTCTIDPVLSTSVVAHVDSSSGAAYSVGFLFIGSAPAQIPLSLGGDLLVLPQLTIPFVVFKDGFDFVEELAYDAALAGAAVYAQVLQFDSAASKGVSFTPGLELHLGF